MTTGRRYKITDERFGRLALTLREKARLTQHEVAAALGVSERTIRYWEDGTTFPTGTNLKQLIALYLRAGSFSAGRERDEARALWEQADASAVRRKSLFDEAWFDELLGQVLPGPQRSDSTAPADQANGTPLSLAQADWGEAPDIMAVYGREQELSTLAHWVGADRARVVAVLGLGGIGKTTLALRLAQRLAPQFDRVVWRSLRDAPPPEEFLSELLQTLTTPSAAVAARVEPPISALIDFLRRQRCLLVLDNADTLLEPGSLAGRYRAGYEGYPLLFQRVAQTAHQSCLLLTSREMPAELEPFEGTQSPVRSLQLFGLARPASQELLFDKDLFGTPLTWDRFIAHYAGNPLALKIAAATAHALFGGDLGLFIEQGPVTLYSLQQLLDDHLTRLSRLERDVLVWLAIERDPAAVDELRANFVFPPPRKDLLAALNSLQRRSLVERGERGASFTLQPVVMEHVSDWLVTQIHAEIVGDRLEIIAKYALMKSESIDHARDSQVRMIVQPLLDRLLSYFGDSTALERQLLRWLEWLRGQPEAVQGYAGGNLTNLLVCLNGHLRAVDLSGLSLRQAHLQGIDAQGASLAGAVIHASRFTEPIETIVSMTLSPDGEYLAMGSFSGQIRVWRVENVRPVWAARGHPRMAWALAYSPDGSMLASGGFDGKVRLWDAVTGRLRSVYAGSPGPLRALAFSPGEPLLAGAGDDGTVRLWDMRDGTCRQQLQGHRGPIWSLAFDRAGDLLVTGGIDGTARVWDPQIGTCLRVLQRHSSGIFTVAFEPHRAVVACGTEDGQISMWNAWNGELLATLHRNVSGLATLAFNPEGTLLASGSNQGVVELWAMTGGSIRPLLSILHNRATLVSAVAFGPDGRLASVSRGGQVKLWDAQSGKLLRTIQGYSRLITALSFSPDGRHLVQGSDNGMLRVWDVRSGQCLHAMEGHRGPVWTIAWHPEGKIFASGGDDGAVKLWAAQSGRCVRSLDGQAGLIWTLGFSPDGTVLAAAGVDKVIKLWRVGRGAEDTPAVILGGSGDQIVSLAFSADGNVLASGHRDGELRLWGWKHSTLSKTLQQDQGPVVAVLLSADTQTLISCNNNDRLAWWDLATGRLRERLRAAASGSWLKGAAFSRDGVLLATAGDDQTVKVWAVEQQGAEAPRASFAGHAGQVWAVALSADHHMLASGDDAGIVILWDTRTGEELRRLRTEPPYEQMNIQGITGITAVQRDALLALGAIEDGEGPAA